MEKEKPIGNKLNLYVISQHVNRNSIALLMHETHHCSSHLPIHVGLGTVIGLQRDAHKPLFEAMKYGHRHKTRISDILKM